MKLHLKLNNNNDVYYNCKKPYSYNLYWHMIDGGRGIGKTTTMLIQGCQNAIKNREEFIYLRRYKPEIKNFVTKDSMSKICDGIIYKGDGAGGYTMVCEDDTVGYCIALSTYRNYKSVNFDKVTLIIFDEAIVKRGGKYLYLNDEVTALLEFVSTVQRTRKNLKVFILGNNEDLFNPYYQYFDIPLYDTIYTDKARGIYCEHAKNNPKLLEMEEQTPLFRLIKGTQYGDYHYKNEVISHAEGDVSEKPNSCILLCRLIVNKQTLNVYTFTIKDETHMYVETRPKIINDTKAFPLFDNTRVNYYFVNRFRNTYKDLVARLYYTDRVHYDNQRTVNIFGWIIEEVN